MAAPSNTEAPPTYSQATSNSSFSHQTRNGIPPERRRSMEDESRPLPTGWVRSYDPESQHQFFVDTTKDPPRSIWHHPYDDEAYLATLEPNERQHLTRLHKSLSLKDIEAESSDDEGGPHATHQARSKGESSHVAPLPPRPGAAGSSSSEVSGFHKFSRKLKDKVTQSTHQEREQRRIQRTREEQAAYERHAQLRQAFSRAIQTGEPQFIGKDREGRDVFIESPYGLRAPSGAYGYNPYAQGPYANPNARFVRPQAPYGRPNGYGYGGGYGLPIVSHTYLHESSLLRLSTDTHRLVDCLVVRYWADCCFR